MHGLETLMRLNREIGQPELPGRRLRHHPRIAQLCTEVARLRCEENYRRWLYRTLNLYADQVVERPRYKLEDGWDDLEALQQAALSDMMELSMRMVSVERV